MSLGRAPLALACLVAAVAIVLAGCGGGSDSSGTSSAAVESRPAPPKSDFPSAAGKTLAEIVEAADGPSELVVSPAAKVFYKGKNRYPFGVFERDRGQVPNAEVALYFAPVPVRKGAAVGSKQAKEAQEEALDQAAIGPFPAAVESMETKPAFRALTTTSDPDAATAVYAAEVDFPANGEWRTVALIREGGELKTSLLPSPKVGAFTKIPRPGQKAPLIHTPTPSDVGGEVSKITTRVPPDTQHEVDYADALGKEPIVLLFATPQFCQSRVCGPVVDVAEQVKETYGDDAAFIHMEIYNDNDPSKGTRPQVRAFHLPSEPWLFAIDRSGRIESEISGAFGVEKLTSVVKGLIGE
ncbi:MAG TPA: hypothetical protein VF245_08795 [Solirubrobacterales bacterium]